MSTSSDSKFRHRDGTSRTRRRLDALDPHYVAVDERKTRDLLAFAQQYAKELRYFNERNEPQGDWSAFLAGDVDEIAAHLHDAETFQHDPDKQIHYSRPHLALFLTFLQLLKHTQKQLNDLTHRHLEFYYREALRLTSKDGVADSVHVLVELVNGQPQLLLPAGTLFSAGQDSLGEDLFYKTDHDLVANQAQVTSLKSLFVQKQVFGIREVHQDPDCLLKLNLAVKRTWADEPDADKAFLAMMDMALGDPDPGDPLPIYPGGKTADQNLFKALDALIHFIKDQLCMSLSVFRDLMERKRSLEASSEKWDRVNEILQAAGQKKRPGDEYIFEPPKKDAFEQNHVEALRLGPPNFAELSEAYDGLPEVNDIYELYFQYLRYHNRDAGQDVQERRDIEAFIKGEDEQKAGLSMSLSDFETMMGYIDETYLEWRSVYDILRAAGKKKANALPEHKLTPLTTKDLRADDANKKFLTITKNTIGAFTDPNISGMTLQSLDDCYQQVLTLEKYFYMSAEDFARVRQIQTDKHVQPWQWEQVYDILQAARRKRVLAKKRPERQQAPLIEKWRNIYAAADATQVQVRVGTKDREESAGWKTFGEGFRADGKPRTAPAQIGLAIASPLLALAEGQRTIIVTLHFENSFDKAALDADINGLLPFRFRLSAAKQMFDVRETKNKGGDKSVEIEQVKDGLKITLHLDEQAPPVAPLTTEPSICSPWPFLQILLNDVQKGDREPVTKRYHDFQHLTLQKVTMQVTVNGLTQLTLQSDDAILDAKKPFEPFGLSPVVGSSFYFAHPELCSKSLDKLRMRFEWLGVPDDLHSYYRGYQNYDQNGEPQSPITGNRDFRARLCLHDVRTSWELTSIELFACSPKALSGNVTVENDADAVTGTDTKFKTELAAGNRINIGSEQFNVVQIDSDTLLKVSTNATAKSDKVALTRVVATPKDVTAKIRGQAGENYQHTPDSEAPNEVLDWSRYWQLELVDRDFMHAIYPKVAARFARKDETENQSKPFIVNPPYTPKIKRLTLGYSASVVIEPPATEAAVHQLYHVEPFGYRPIPKLPGNGKDKARYPFLPQYENQGELYIGVEALAPPQNLSLLFQMAEGSADPDLPRQAVHWEYLSGNVWLSLEKGNLLSDTTDGLLNTGVITFSLEPAEPSTLLPPQWYWIRATIAQHSRSVCDTVAIRAQVVRAVFEDRDNAPDHFSRPLPPDRIKDLAEPLPQVKAIHQPYSSVGGKAAELPSHFYTRVAERLRHKNRALTCWDFERMILEEFPEIYKVKCLPVGAAKDPRQADRIQVIVIPDIRGKHPFDPFEPKVPADTLVKIERFLSRHASPLARFDVKNPRYENLLVRCSVRFRDGCNPGFYETKLNDELVRFLAPWAYDEAAEIVLGGRLNASVIIKFLEDLPYVDYLASIKLFTRYDDGRFRQVRTSAGTLAEVAPDGVLVSERQHIIDLITQQDDEKEYFAGINYMIVELDFVIG